MQLIPIGRHASVKRHHGDVYFLLETLVYLEERVVVVVVVVVVAAALERDEELALVGMGSPRSFFSACSSAQSWLCRRRLTRSCLYTLGASKPMFGPAPMPICICMALASSLAVKLQNVKVSFVKLRPWH